MKLLIITSEFLYEGHTLGSTFELSQAQILSQKYDVNILSVSRPDSLIAACKSFVKKVALLTRQQPMATVAKRLNRAISSVIIGKKIVARYNIEGIKTYEGFFCTLFSYGNFERHLRLWVKAGKNAFEAYCNDNGTPDIIHAHGRFLNAGALALAIKSEYGISYVYTDHSTFYKQGIAPVAAKPVLSNVIAESEIYITVSKPLEKEIALFLGQPVKKATIVPNVIDRIFESPLEIADEQKNNFTFITVAALEHKKGIDILIRAFATAFRNKSYYKLVISGDGILKNSLISLAKQSGIYDNINFTGVLSKKEILEWLDKSDAMVLPSRVETFGVVIIEAMARGKPIISTRSGGPEYIVNDNSGILIEPEDENALANALIFLSDNINQYKKETIRNCALKQYGTQTFLANMEKVYNFQE